jgi:hypothetical protein
MESLRDQEKEKSVTKTISIYPDTIKKVFAYQLENNIMYFSEAVERLILKGLKK